MKKILLLALAGLLFFSFKEDDKDFIAKEEKEKMYQIALDTDSLTPWLKLIYSDSIRYCYRRGKPCSYLEANEYIDSSYTLYKRGIKLEIIPVLKISAESSLFHLIIKDVEQRKDQCRFKIHYYWACNSTIEETCTQVYSSYRFVKIDGNWKLYSHEMYEEVSYNKFSFVDRDVMTKWSIKKQEEQKKTTKLDR